MSRNTAIYVAGLLILTVGIVVSLYYNNPAGAIMLLVGAINITIIYVVKGRAK
jgi:hypothetical protein